MRVKALEACDVYGIKRAVGDVFLIEKDQDLRVDCMQRVLDDTPLTEVPVVEAPKVEPKPVAHVERDPKHAVHHETKHPKKHHG